MAWNNIPFLLYTSTISLYAWPRADKKQALCVSTLRDQWGMDGDGNKSDTDQSYAPVNKFTQCHISIGDRESTPFLSLAKSRTPKIDARLGLLLARDKTPTLNYTLWLLCVDPSIPTLCSRSAANSSRATLLIPSSHMWQATIYCTHT